MLLNLAQSLRDLGKLGEAACVNRAALELPGDHTSDLHRIHLATDAALAGKPDPLDGVVLPEKGYYRWLAELTLALGAATRAADRRSAWREARPHLQRARAPSRLAMKEPFLFRYRLRVIWAIARRRAGLLAPLWFVVGF
jgi:hypothetical protein